MQQLNIIVKYVISCQNLAWIAQDQFKNDLERCNYTSSEIDIF